MTDSPYRQATGKTTIWDRPGNVAERLRSPAFLQQLQAYLATFLTAYNGAKRLNTLHSRTPYEYISTCWLFLPARVKINPTHSTVGRNIRQSFTSFNLGRVDALTHERTHRLAGPAANYFSLVSATLAQPWVVAANGDSLTSSLQFGITNWAARCCPPTPSTRSCYPSAGHSHVIGPH